MEGPGSVTYKSHNIEEVQTCVGTQSLCLIHEGCSNLFPQSMFRTKQGYLHMSRVMRKPTF